MNRVIALPVKKNGAEILPLRRFYYQWFQYSGGYQIDLWNSFKVQDLSVDFVGSFNPMD